MLQSLLSKALVGHRVPASSVSDFVTRTIDPLKRGLISKDMFLKFMDVDQHPNFEAIDAIPVDSVDQEHKDGERRVVVGLVFELCCRFSNG